ncbi:putative hydrolase (plasmid) [Streptomyces hygroscopicus subsp. jinggangensis 5008]|nr:putative hydrolase [Streptomyces hygroscopicus subsp. jinggangensis 5008]AGF68354.1 putative hydrolase [Streptomyces hygroscopicus subsp. jinggangensis TL01]
MGPLFILINDRDHSTVPRPPGMCLRITCRSPSGGSLATARTSRVPDVQKFALFGLDGTLADRQSAFNDAITGLCRTRTLSPSVERWLRTELADRATAGDFARLREAFGLETSAADLWQEYVDLMADAVTCLPEVFEGLARLRAAVWTIDVVTNRASDIQRAKLAGTGLACLVDGVAASGNLEIRKPDRRLFELGAAWCGASLADGGWMVGDSPAGDIGGGHQAGLRTIWLRGRPWTDGLPAAHHVVDDVTDAITILLNETWE